MTELVTPDVRYYSYSRHKNLYRDSILHHENKRLVRIRDKDEVLTLTRNNGVFTMYKVHTTLFSYSEVKEYLMRYKYMEVLRWIEVILNTGFRSTSVPSDLLPIGGPPLDDNSNISLILDWKLSGKPKDKNHIHISIV